MPPEMRSKYGYDSKRAAAFSAVVEQAQRSNIEQQQKVREEAAADALRADEERARLSEEFSKRQAANGKISASEALRNVGFSMQGTVLQRTSEGLLVRSTTAGKGGDFWLVGYDAPEDSRISVKVTVAGTKEYTTVRDAVRMVDMYRFVQQNSPPVPVAP